jgi:adenine deaminase
MKLDLHALLPIAQGKRPAELVLKDLRIMNVFTGKEERGDIAVAAGVIVGIGRYRGLREIQMGGRWAVPGLVDAHVHMESSMVSPRLFLQRVLPWGTTTLIADPHEIVNVLGAKGFRYMLRETEGVPANVYLMMPSCVPSNRVEHNGGRFSLADMAQLRGHPRVLGLGEVMDCPAVLGGDEKMLEKLAFCADMPIDGHAPGLAGGALQAYRLAGIRTDHECTAYEEARERVARGFTVQVREGSGAKDLEAILSGALRDGLPFSRFVFCTDDKHLGDIRREGHIRWNVRRAIELGVPPIDAVRMATIQPAEAYGLRDIGALCPGYRADILVLDDLESMEVHSVYKDGVRISEKGSPVPVEQAPCDDAMKRTVRVRPLAVDDLRLPVDGPFPVIEVQKNALLTRKRMMELPQRDGMFQPGDGLLKIATIERHRATKHIGVGAILGLGLRGGAVASTVAHDAHNLIVAGDSDEDMLAAVEALRACQGGYAVAAGGTVRTLPLPVAGLFTDDPGLDVEGRVEELLALCKGLGVPQGVDPFITLSFMALPAIPELRVTDAGLYDVTAGRLIR